MPLAEGVFLVMMDKNKTKKQNKIITQMRTSALLQGLGLGWEGVGWGGGAQGAYGRRDD